ncbi:MAG: hypothetical protein ABUL60_21090 [Myxococcales bacterium]
MRAAMALIHAVILGAAVVLASGCAAKEPTTPIGMSDAVPEKARAREVEAPRAAWPDFAAARAWPEAGPASVALAHRRDGTLVHVRVEPAALAAYRELSVEAPMPDGARVVAWHESPSGTLLGGYLLEKRSGAWAALELDANGALVVGDHARCVRCHDMAPTDHLFGLRSALRPAPSVSGESIVPSAR